MGAPSFPSFSDCPPGGFSSFWRPLPLLAEKLFLACRGPAGGRGLGGSFSLDRKSDPRPWRWLDGSPVWILIPPLGRSPPDGPPLGCGLCRREKDPHGCRGEGGGLCGVMSILCLRFATLSPREVKLLVSGHTASDAQVSSMQKWVHLAPETPFPIAHSLGRAELLTCSAGIEPY